MAQGLYLGKRFDPKSGALGERFELVPARTVVKLLRYDLLWVY